MEKKCAVLLYFVIGYIMIFSGVPFMCAWI